MIPLLPFAAGLAAGILGIRLAKGVKTADYRSVNTAARERLARAGNGLRQATAAGLVVVEQSSASLRSHLIPEPAVEEVQAPPSTRRKRAGRPKAAAAVAEVTPTAKPVSRKRSPRKAASASTEKTS